jgi:hypothetical protein
MSEQAKPEKAGFNLFRYIDDWWFGKGSPVTLGVFRIIIAGVCFINLAMIAIDFQDWYSESGFVPQEIAQRYAPNITHSFNYGDTHIVPWFPVPRINLLGGIESTPITAVFYALVMAAALLTMIGLWSRVSSIALAVGLITLHHRNLLILHGGDTALRQFIIILALSPCGAACSLDRFIAVWRGKAPPTPPLISLWGQRLVQYQIAILYLTATWYKWQGSHWRDGTATWYISQLREFDRFPVPPFLEQQPFIGITTYGTLLTELSMATLVFYRPLRKWVLIAALAMHGYIEYRFNIPMFAFVVTSAYVCFYDGEEIVAWAKRFGQRYRRLALKVWLPQDRRLEGAKADAIRGMDPMGIVEYAPGETADWHAETYSGKPRNPFRASWQRSIGAWPLGLVPGLWKRLVQQAAIPGKPAPSPNGEVPQEKQKIKGKKR